MALNAKKMKSNTNFKRPPALEPGTYPARLVQVISLGLQKQRPFKGEAKDPKYELMTTYEFLDEFLLDEETGEEIKDKPRWLSETFPFYSLDADRAKSTQRYVALDPHLEFDGDWAQLVGTPCMLTITNSQGKGERSDIVYENIAGVSTMREKDAAKAPPLVNEPKVFDIDEPDLEVFISLPDWLKDKIKENLEFAGSVLDKALQASKGGDTKEEASASQGSSEGVSDTTEESDEVSW